MELKPNKVRLIDKRSSINNTSIIILKTLEVKMKKNWLLSVLVFIIVISTSGCNLSFQNTNPTPFFPTPNYTMTALFSVDENMLTSTPHDYAVNTSAPQLPTIRLRNRQSSFNHPVPLHRLNFNRHILHMFRLLPGLQR